MDIKIALVGLGYWGPNLLRNLNQLGVLAAAFDLDEDKLKRFANDKTYSGVFFDKDWEKSLGRRKVDGVVIATPPSTHYVLAKKVLEHGKHVLVEKPLTLEVDHAEELVSLAQEKDKILMVGHTFLYSPEIVKLKEIVNSKDFGQIYYMYSKRLNLGKLQWPANVVEDLAPHDISIFNFLVDEECIEVQAFGSSYVIGDIEEVAFLNMKYDSGINAHMHLSWLDPMKVRDIIVVGSKQMVTCDCGTKRIEIYNKGVDINVRKNISNIDYAQHLLNYKYGDITIPYIDTWEPLYVECNDFINSIKAKRQPRSNGKVGLDVVKVLNAAQMSLKYDSEWMIVR